jgi:hypothetical protein
MEPISHFPTSLTQVPGMVPRESQYAPGYELHAVSRYDRNSLEVRASNKLTSLSSYCTNCPNLSRLCRPSFHWLKAIYHYTQQLLCFLAFCCRCALQRRTNHHPVPFAFFFFSVRFFSLSLMLLPLRCRLKPARVGVGEAQLRNDIITSNTLEERKFITPSCRLATPSATLAFPYHWPGESKVRRDCAVEQVKILDTTINDVFVSI